MASYQTLYRRIKKGDYVRLKRQLETKGGRLFAKDLIMQVTHKHGGLHLETVNDKPCVTCGIGDRRSISRINVHDVEHLPDYTPKKN